MQRTLRSQGVAPASRERELHMALGDVESGFLDNKSFPQRVSVQSTFQGTIPPDSCAEELGESVVAKGFVHRRDEDRVRA